MSRELILYISTTCLYFILEKWIVWVDDKREVEEGQNQIKNKIF